MEIVNEGLSTIIIFYIQHQNKIKKSLILLFVLHRLSKWIKRLYLKSVLKKAVGERLQSRSSQINQLRNQLATKDHGIVTERRRILSLSFNDLIAELQSGRLTALHVLEAYQEKAVQAQVETNCIQQFILEARDWAMEWDRKASNGIPKPPLFGIPISVKDNMPVKDYESPYGHAIKLIGLIKNKRDSTAVETFRKLGAIPFCITNMPQTGLSLGSSNPIYGVTTNPHDKKRGPGGSSSGEGSLIGFGGSVLGIGTDVGGSIRMPAHFCGIAGLKPSSMRVSQRHKAETANGRIWPRSTWGPMGRDVDTLTTTMRHICDDVMFEADPMMAPVKFDESQLASQQKLTIGYYFDNGHIPVVPACRRAVEATKTILEKNGHTLVPFNVPGSGHCMQIAHGAVFMDGGKKIGAALRADLKDPLHTQLFSKFPSTTSQVVKLLEDVDMYRIQFVAEWERMKLDAVICPAHVCTPLPYELPSTLVSTVSYTIPYNVLDFSAGVLPVTKVTNEDDVALDNYPATDTVTRTIGRGCKGGQGLPVGVQVVTPPFKEEVCLRLMKEIEDNVNLK